MKKYADVILPLPLPGTFTYILPQEASECVQPGCRVVVPFGQKKIYTGIVYLVHDCEPSGYELKEVLMVLDSFPVVSTTQLKLWEWIAGYYLCTLGDVYKAALPSGMKLESETVVTANPDFIAGHLLPEREQVILDTLERGKGMSLTALEKRSGARNIWPAVKSLLEKGVLTVKEELRRSYKPKTEARVRLADAHRTERDTEEAFRLLQRASAQQHLFLKYLELSGYAETGIPGEVPRSKLLSTSPTAGALLKKLVERGILEVYAFETGRLSTETTGTDGLNPLNPAQQEAHQQILASFRQKDTCLLHGVTSSGKTEIYTHLIEQTLREGKQVLYMLPEIALTTQITERLRRVFGGKMGVYHSKFPDAERVEIWRKQMGNEPYEIILGVRSSVFLPFRKLGLIIVDEEHENTYKQQDSAPRYHARDTAIVLASLYGVKTLLATATPSIETYYNATTGKYGLVELKERYKGVELPEIIAVDIKELKRKKRMKGLFSPLLLENMRHALENNGQVILFQNRRGFAPMVECNTCGWTPKCQHCDVSLTYHKSLNRLTCHYCGAVYHVPASCPACEGTDLRPRGFGTEKVAEEIKEIFPHAGIARMDVDTTRSRSAYETIIEDFQLGRTHILIGTQMVSKGLDFGRVSVVGILNADTMLNYPDFRSYERAFQLMAQVAGRAGRRDKRGKVILQTKSMEHPIIRQVIENDYEQMVNNELAERKLFHYPPYHRLIYIYMKHRNAELLDRAAEEFSAMLRPVFGSRVLGPDRPPVGRVQALHIKKMILKVEAGASMTQVGGLLRELQLHMTANDKYRSVIMYYDVGPA